jgi:hypothetical protein
MFQENEDHQTEMQDRLELEKQDLQRRLEEQLEGERNLQVRLEALQIDGDITQRQLNAVQVHLRDLQTNNSNSKQNENKESSGKFIYIYYIYCAIFWSQQNNNITILYIYFF